MRQFKIHDMGGTFNSTLLHRLLLFLTKTFSGPLYSESGSQLLASQSYESMLWVELPEMISERKKKNSRNYH